jgi:tetratricopeptide (TPR) repeat protein
MILFEIYKIRYYLVLGELSTALDQINELNNMVSSFDTKQLYYWFKFRGIYSTFIGEHTASIEKYQRAEKLVRKSDVSDEEIADLHYIMSIAYSKLRHTLEAIDYANQAIDVFMKKYNFVRCAQCHIVLGISYRRIKMYDKAIKNYNLAKHLASLDNNNDIIQLTNQNLGYLHSASGKMPEAIEFYTEIMEHDEVDPVEKLAAITELIKVNYEIEAYDKVHALMDLAMTLLEEYPEHTEYEYYYNVIHTYYYSLNDEHERFIDIVKNRFIPFLKKHKDYVSLATFASMLAKHYETIHKYKDATKFYKLSNQSYKELSNI